MAATATGTGPLPRGGPIRTLIVDDSPGALNAICGIVASMRNVEIVATATDGCEALAQARRHRPRLVLMDVQMPCMDGVRAVRQLQRELPGTHVILFSTHECAELQALCRDSGARALIRKARLRQELAAIIEGLEADLKG